MKKSELDLRICDCKEGVENTQTYREFIEESEKEFGMQRMPIDDLGDEELNVYFEFLDYLWEK
jgi:hypothetical protein